MFKSTPANPYDDVVGKSLGCHIFPPGVYPPHTFRHNEKVKATDETLTGENWEIILNLCDKVQDEGEQGSVSPPLFTDYPHTFASARNVIAAVLKRLAHRNPNVQLYSLTLTESLSKNCTKDLHSEIASRAFTQALERLITDRVRTLTISPLLQCL
jgi:hypothetical protein